MRRRYLFVVPPFSAHINPTVALAGELARRGHAVGWVAYESVRAFLPDGAWLHALRLPIAGNVMAELRRRAGEPWLAGLKVLFEDVLVPLANDMLPGVDAAIEAFRPDVLIVDQQAVAGALAARRAGLPWVTSAPTAALHGDSLAAFPAVRDWMARLYDDLQRDADLAPIAAPDCSDRLVLLYTSRLLAGTTTSFPAHYRFVGPLLCARPTSAEFPWHELRDGRRVFVSLGTQWADRGERFFGVVVEALANAPLQVIVHAPPGFIPAPPANFIVRAWVPLPELYPHLDGLVSHAGSTVPEALYYGLPAVVAPIAHEQVIFAQQAVAAGAALRVRFNRVGAPELRRAVMTILDDVSYKAAAQKVQASLQQAGGASAAATAIEAIG